MIQSEQVLGKLTGLVTAVILRLRIELLRWVRRGIEIEFRRIECSNCQTQAFASNSSELGELRHSFAVFGNAFNSDARQGNHIQPLAACPSDNYVDARRDSVPECFYVPCHRSSLSPKVQNHIGATTILPQGSKERLLPKVRWRWFQLLGEGHYFQVSARVDPTVARSSLGK